MSDGENVTELARVLDPLLSKPGVRAALDELAALGRGEHVLGGADVRKCLAGVGTMTKETKAEHATSIRLGAEDLAKLDRVVEVMAGSEVARLVGGRWGRSTVLRLAVGRGLDALLAEHGGGR